MKSRCKKLCTIWFCILFIAICTGCHKETLEEPESENESEIVRVIDGNANLEEINNFQEDITENGTPTPGDNEVADVGTSIPDEPAVQKKGILIALDPGHQGWDIDMSAVEPNAPGSDVMKAKATSGTSGTYSGIPEFQLCLDIAVMLKSELENRGYDVLMTREDNETAISNSERAILANDAGASISVRIHANGSENPGAQGALALITSPDNPYTGSLYNDSVRLAELVLESYCAATGLANQGIQQNDTMTGINWSKIPVMILEMGFMTNEEDDLKMADGAFRTKMVQGIADGIDSYYNTGD